MTGSEHRDDGNAKRRWFAHGIRPAEWIMIAFTAATAISAIAGTLIANGQLGAMRDQFAEMHSGGIDAHKLAVATADFAATTKVQANNTAALVDQAKKSASAAENSALAAGAQLGEMRTEQRAWVSLENVEAIEPLTYDANGVRLGLKFNAKNSGKNLATNVFIGTEAKVTTVLTPRWERHVCLGRPSVGIALAGGDDQFINEIVTIPRTDLDQLMSFLRPDDAKVISPVIAACLFYRDAVTGRWHHTPYGFEIQMKSRPGREGGGILVSDGPIAISDLSILLVPGMAGRPD